MRSLVPLVCLCIGMALGRYSAPEPAPSPRAALGQPCTVENLGLDDQAAMQSLIAEITPLAESDERVTDADLKHGLANAVADVHLGSSVRPAGEGPMALPELYRFAKGSVYLIGKPYKCPKCDHWHVSGATAFAVAPDGVLATNHHVVEGDYATMVAVDDDGEVHPVLECLAGSKADDVALVRIASRTRPLPIRELAEVGTRVAVVSHPNMRAYTLTDGIVSRYWVHPQSRALSMAITADYAVGSSGAPVLDDRGQVVGMASATEPVYYESGEGEDAEKVLQMGVKRCVPAEAILRIAGH